MQEKDITNAAELTDLSLVPKDGRILAIDPGMRYIGVAVCDEMRVITRPLPAMLRSSWKKLLASVRDIIAEFDAKALVVGLPLESDGSESPMSVEARSMARKFALSLEIPVVLQDERVTSYEARGRLWERGVDPKDTKRFVDSEAAAIILADLLDRLSEG